jgi:SAM-dependent methyltransferase
LRPTAAYVADDGAAYERFLGRWTGRLAEALIDFAELPADGPVLDVGCGTGSVAFELRRRYPGRSVWAVDASAAYLAFAREREGGEGIQFEQADAADLPFAAGMFSASIAQLALNFMPDARKVAQEMRRVTCSGGVLAAAVWDFRGGLVFQRLFWDTAAAIDSEAAATRGRLFSHPLAQSDGLARLWREIELRDVDEGSLTIRMDYEGFDDYWEPLLGGQGPFGSYVAGLSEERRARIHAAVSGAYRSGTPDGRRSLAATAWAVRGRVP